MWEWGGFAWGSPILGPFSMGLRQKSQQQLASEKEIQMQLQDEVRLPLGSCPCL